MLITKAHSKKLNRWDIISLRILIFLFPTNDPKKCQIICQSAPHFKTKQNTEKTKTKKTTLGWANKDKQNKIKKIK